MGKSVPCCRVEEDEKLTLMPFEKNLDVWRQLWRVLERSHIVVQVPPRTIALIFLAMPAALLHVKRSQESDDCTNNAAEVSGGRQPQQQLLMKHSPMLITRSSCPWLLFQSTHADDR